MGRMSQPRSDRGLSRELPDEVLAYLYSSLIFLLRRTDQRAVSLFNNAAKGLRLTLPQWHILYIASEVGAFSQVELARQVATNEATASTTISHLAERGLIERVADSRDGRRKVIVPTAAGRELTAAALPAFRKAVADLEAPLGDRAAGFRGLLAELVARAGGDIPFPADLSPHAVRLLGIVQGSTHFLVRRTIQIIESAAAPHHNIGKVTLRQYVVLLIVALAPGIGESRIASTIGLDLSNASFIARGLRSKKLVEVDQSSRRRRYTATPAGYQLIARIEPQIAAAVADVLAQFEPAKREALLRMLGDLIAAGRTIGVPPSFARIRKRPDWPAAQRPSQFDLLLPGRRQPLVSDAEEFLRRAADVVAERGEAAIGLTAQERTEFTRLLTKIVSLAEKKTTRSGSK